MVNHLINKYQASKEAKGKQKQILTEPRDTNKTIKHLYKHTHNGFERLREMENLVGIPYHLSDFIHHVYMLVKNL